MWQDEERIAYKSLGGANSAAGTLEKCHEARLLISEALAQDEVDLRLPGHSGNRRAGHIPGGLVDREFGDHDAGPPRRRPRLGYGSLVV